MNKVTVAAIIIILVAFGGLIAWTSINGTNKIDFSKYDSSKVISASEDNGNIGDHARGKEDSEVIVVEYADMQCEHCGTMMPKMSTLYKEYGDRVKFIFRHYPLSYHQNAIAAAAAAESAGSQGYFWEMLETIYDNQSEWSGIKDTQQRTNTFAEYFDAITDGKGNHDDFIRKLSDASVRKKIDFDYNLGKNNDSIGATPTIFVNGQKADPSDNSETIEGLAEKMIKEELTKRNIDAEPKKAEEE